MGAAFHLSINLESLPIGQMVFVGNQAERDTKSLKSRKKWFDISPMRSLNETA